MDDATAAPTKLELPQDLAEQLIARFGEYIQVFNSLLASLQRAAERVAAATSGVVDGSSTKHAANKAAARVAHFQERVGFFLPRFNQLQNVARLRELFQDPDPNQDLVRFMDSAEYCIDEIREYFGELWDAVEAVEFAATFCQRTDANQAHDRASKALAQILSGVTALRELGFRRSSVAGLVDDWITLRSECDITLLAPTADANSKESARNKKSAAKKRARLLADNKSAKRFLDDFWFTFWRAAYDKNRPQEWQEEHINFAMRIIPGMLDAESSPLSRYDVEAEVWSALKKEQKKRPSLRDEHVFAAIDRLLDSASGAPLDVVVVGPIEASKIWTRQRAEAAKASIVVRQRPDRHAAEPLRNESAA